jgi:hypothetical protein
MSGETFVILWEEPKDAVGHPAIHEAALQELSHAAPNVK